MEITESFNQEVISYDYNCINEVKIAKLRSLRNVSPTENEDDVVLEPCIPGECICITHHRGVKYEYFHFYVGVLEDFNIHLPFIDFDLIY